MSDDVITVRPLGADDEIEWARLYHGFLDSMQRTATPEAIADIFTRLVAPGDTFALLAEHGRAGRLVGFAHYLFHANVAGPDVAYLQDLCTEEAMRGRGVGRALIASVADAARAHGCERLYWHTNTANATARRLYDDVATFRGVIRYELDLPPAPSDEAE